MPPLVDHYSIPALDIAGEPDQADRGTIDSHKLVLHGGEVLVSRLNPRKPRVHKVPPNLSRFSVASTEFVPLRALAIDTTYLRYLLLSETVRQQLDSHVRSATRSHQRVDASDVLNLLVPVEDTGEQQRIADFLDDRVARIDQIITARRTQIAAVREHWALELEWVLGSISETTRASRVLRVMPGFAFPSEAYSEDPSDRRLLRGVNVAVGSTRWDEVVYWPEDRVDEVGEFVLGAGDLVLGMDRPWIGDGLRIARVTEDDGSPLLLQRVAKLASDVLDSEYLFWAYQSRRFRDQVELDLTGLSVPHLSGDQIGSFDIPVCDAHRQAAVVRALNAGTESVSRLINAIGASIGRLDEYKQSLITAAVTGEIDVTAAGGGTPG